VAIVGVGLIGGSSPRPVALGLLASLSGNWPRRCSLQECEALWRRDGTTFSLAQGCGGCHLIVVCTRSPASLTMFSPLPACNRRALITDAGQH